MTQKEILFVSYQDETFEDGLSYAIYLAGMLGVELRVLLLGKKSFWDKFDDMMAAVSLADSGANEIPLGAPDGNGNHDAARMQVHIMERCEQAGLKATVHTRLSASASVIKDLLGRVTINMVLLSPAISKSDKFIRSLTKDTSYPVVTISQCGTLDENLANH